jgi:hypothetical protein
MQTVIISVVQYLPPKFSFAYCSHAWCTSVRALVHKRKQVTTVETYFGRFADLLSYDLPFVGVILLDGGKQRSALLTHQHTLYQTSQ